MSNLTFWAGFAPVEQKEARFGLIPKGEHHVWIIDVKPMMASQNFNLLDDRKIGPLKPKEKFEAAFDQEVLAVVFANEEGHVIIDRRSSVGWLTSSDQKATPEMVQKYGLKAIGDRFVTPKGKGVASTEKTESCKDMASRLFNAAGAKSLNELIGKELKIVVKEKRNADKASNEVCAYYPVERATTAAKTEKPAQAPAPDNDDLPF